MLPACIMYSAAALKLLTRALLWHVDTFGIGNTGCGM